MVQQVTLPETAVASSGNPNFLPSFAGPIRALGSALGSLLEGGEEVDTTISDFQQKVSDISLAIGQGRAIDRKSSKLALSALQKTASIGKDARTVAALEAIRQGALSKAGSIGQFQLQEIEFEEQQAAESNRKLLETVTTLLPSAIDAPRDVQVKLAKTLQELQAESALNQLQTENINSNLDLSETEKVAGQIEILNRSVNGGVLGWTRRIKEVIGDVTSESSPEEKIRVKQALIDLQLENQAELEVNYREAINSGRVDGILAMRRTAFESAINSLDSTDNLRSWENESNIRVAMAFNKMLTPEVVNTMAFWKGVANIPVELLLGNRVPNLTLEQTKSLRTFFLAAGKNWLNETPESIVTNEGDSEEEILQKTDDFSKQLGDVYTQDLMQEQIKTNPAGASELIKPLIVNTKKMLTEGKQVSPTTYSQTFRILASDLDTVKALVATQGGEEFLQNVKAGVKSYTDSLAQVLAKDLDEEINDRVPVTFFKELPEPEFKKFGPFKLQVNPALNAVPESVLARESFFPRTANVVEIELIDDGSIQFKPRRGLEENAAVVSRVKTLNKRFSKEFRQIARSQAHYNQGNEDYSTAQHDIITQDRRFSDIFVAPTSQTLTPKEEKETVLEQKQTAEFEKKVEDVKPSINSEDLRNLLNEGKKEEVIKLLKDSGLDQDTVKEVFDLNIPDLSKAEEGSIIQLNDGTIAVVKNGKLVEPTAGDLQLG